MSLLLDQKGDILDQLFSLLKVDFSACKQKILAQFISAFYADVAIRDLTQMSQADLLGLTVSLWRETQCWKKDKAKIQVFNPDVEQDEWQSLHTVITVLCKNIPFVIDTLKLVFNEKQIKIHRIFYSELACKRGDTGKLISLDEQCNSELLLYFEIDQTSIKSERDALQVKIEQALEDVCVVVDDYKSVIKTLNNALTESKNVQFHQYINALQDQQEFLNWMLNEHFTFIGCDQFLVEKGELKTVKDSQLGLLKRPDFMVDPCQFESVRVLSRHTLIHFSKASQRAMVHRCAYPDIVYVKCFDKTGQLVSGYRFIGLYTSSVYSGSPADIPVVASKIEYILESSAYPSGSHYYKELMQILYTYPIEDLLLCDQKTLLHNAVEILYVQERKELKLFLRSEANNQFVIASLYVPRDVYSTQVRLSFEALIGRTLEVCDSDFQVFLSESTLARLRLVLRLKTPLNKTLEVVAIEQRMKQLTKRWGDELQESLFESLGEELGVKLIKKYGTAFSSSYQDIFSSRIAVADIERIESLYSNQSRSMTLRFYRSIEANRSELKLKLFHQDGALLLSDLIPILENLGLQVAEEYPYKITPVGEKSFWLYDFTLLYTPVKDIDPDVHRERFADAFLSVWYGHAENDAFNKLILGADLTWQDISVLRAYAKYLKQIRFGFSHASIAATLLAHSKLVSEIILLFKLRFDPTNNGDIAKQEKLQDKILMRLDEVSNLNEDRVLRKYVELIMATLRCNYFQQVDAALHPYISFKFAHELLTELPPPALSYEIFVYSPRFEGLHLRGGKVARGGLRWSDRGEDFRTEILGLVKAQLVKNAVIVPVGAKGGFVAKKINPVMNRETALQEGITCYKTFIQALLDITDNLSHGEVVPPVDVRRYDQDDPYLVVAADKGTATFSDIANQLAVQKNFWLDDAFASGGKNGYDHKKMGITARGAWISVQRHFKELGIDVQQQSISVVGIGDMAGDVFGNGMLCSKFIALVAAFNHQHIFIDPTPVDLTASFSERNRLFNTPKSSWSDYNKVLISQGGGIFERALKSITITPEMAKRFAIKEKKLTPNALINALLKAPVDLLWNGGIGTYVKGSNESHADVGDKSNDNLRINGQDLRCVVVAEGGNLGITQSARIEYSLANGLCFSDALDNSAGVNCSDLEVNIKILLDKVVAKGDLTIKQRNLWLHKMTDEVAQLVLKNNYRQTQSVTLSFLDSYSRIEEYRLLINELEEKALLDRALECIPSDELLSERKNSQKGLTRPTLCVLLAYVKNEMKQELVVAHIENEPYLLCEAQKIFPAKLVDKYKNEIDQHPLISEIVATQISNDLFNIMGATFAHRIMSSLGCSFLEVSKAWVAARDIFALDLLLKQIEALDYQIESELQNALIFKLQRMVRHGTRWLIRYHREQLNSGALIKQYQQPLKVVASDIDTVLVGQISEYCHRDIAALTAKNMPKLLAHQLACTEQIYSLLNVISVAIELKVDVHLAAKVHFWAMDKLQLFAVAKQLSLLPIDSHWQSLAKEAMCDELEWQQQRITRAILQEIQGGDVELAFEDWQKRNQELAQRWLRMADALLAVANPEFSMCQVALRELQDLSSR